MLPNGKQRSTKTEQLKEIQQWCLALLSNGEIDPKSHADSGSEKYICRAGNASD